MSAVGLKLSNSSRDALAPASTRQLTKIDLTKPARPSTFGAKVKFQAIKVAIYFGAFVANCVCLFIPVICRAVSHFSLKEARKLFEKNSIAVLQTALNNKLSEKPLRDWTHQELIMVTFRQCKMKNVETFVKETKLIASWIEQGKNTFEIRKKISALMESDVYQKLKHSDNPCVEFLQIVSMKFMGGKVEGASDPFVEYGREQLGLLPGREHFNLGEMATLMDGKLKNTWDFQRNGKLSTFFWAITHLADAVHSKKADLFPTAFNCHEGNPTTYGYDFTLTENSKEKRIRFYYGPGPTGDRLYNDGYLVYMDKLQQKGLTVFERRTNHQNIHKKSEAARIHEMRRYEGQHPNSLRLMSLSFDTPMMDHPHDFTTCQEYFSVLKNVYTKNREYRDMFAEKEQNGVYVGPKVMEDRQITGALDAAEGMFTDISHGNAFWEARLSENAAGKKRLGRMMNLGAHAFLGVGSIYKALQDTASEEEAAQKFGQKLDQDLLLSRASGACKQDIDRAIVENVAERVFFRIMKDPKPLSKEEFYSIAGAVLARAYIVEGRQIQLKRYDLLSDLFHFIGSEENMKKLQGHLKSYVNAQFAPKIAVQDLSPSVASKQPAIPKRIVLAAACITAVCTLVRCFI
jgi:hypothetical protein